MVKKYSFILLVGMLFGVIESGYASIQPDSTRHLLARADSAFADNSYGTAFKYYKAALSSTRTQTDILPPVYLRLGQTCYYTGRYDEGIYYLYELLEKYTPDPLAKTEACILLGNLYLRLRQDSIALRHLHEAQTYLTEEAKMDDSVKMGQYCDLYICFSSVYLQKGDNKQARTCLNEAKRYCGTSSRHLGKIYQNEALFYLAFNDTKKAEAYYEKAIALTDEPYAKSVLVNNLAISHWNNQRYEEALRLLDNNIHTAKAIGTAHVLSNIFSIYSGIYADIGDYRKAYSYGLKYKNISDSIFNAKSDERVLLQNIRYETLKVESEKELVEYKLKVTELENFKKNTLIVFLALLLSSLTVFVFFVVRKAVAQKKRNRILGERLQDIDKEKDEIIRSSKEKYETEIGSKTRKLTANLMHMAEMREINQVVLKDIEKLRLLCPTGEATDLLNDMGARIRSLVTEESGWDVFSLYFEQTHPAFFSELNKSFPTLTPTENRLCAFMIMNLSTKEIAGMTNRSVRTIETLKFRLRKKLEIPKDVSTQAFLQSFNK